MTYNEASKKNIDLASLGSGSKQAILLFANTLAFPHTANLLNEPDAHLEIISVRPCRRVESSSYKYYQWIEYAPAEAIEAEVLNTITEIEDFLK